MNDEEKIREKRCIDLAFIWSEKSEKGFYLLPEDFALIVNLLADGKINKNGSKNLIYEIIEKNKDVAKKAYEILLEKNLIKK
jgi:Asp-tRNA(Asn)/Glu-tRNA(Gln) amidotransferase B subunit